MLLFVELIAGVLLIGAGSVLAGYVRPIDGKVNPRLTPAIEPWVVVAIMSLIVLGIISVFHGIISTLSA